MIMVLFHVTGITGKILLDCNILYSSIIHRIHGHWYCSLPLLLFTMYKFIVYYYTVLLLSLYRLSILGNMDIDYFNKIK